MTSYVSMLTATDARSHIHLIIGSNPLAAARCGQSLSAGASPILLVSETAELHYALQKRIDDGEVKWVKETFRDEHLFTLGREEIDHVVDAVFVTSAREPSSAHISTLCKRNRIPVNVVDAPQLCTFSLLSTHVDGPLQIGITTNGRGCKLASRIRREVAASLPPNLGSACLRLGDVRRKIQEEDHLLHMALADGDDIDDSIDQLSTFNKLVTEADLDAAKNRRMRWLSQICEYWPLKRLAAITDADVSNILQSYTDLPSLPPSLNPNSNSNAHSNTPQKRGRIILAGSGPGHPDLLTRATLKAIRAADLILADKLVPQGVLDLIPRRTPVRIARKFPGNADAAQAELHELAVAAAREGKTVLRLKQGDPYVYGRGGEEVEFFRGQGFGLARGGVENGEGDVVVLPGVTSALSAPLFAGIPATQRDVADQVLICTGTGKKGKAPVPPEFVASRTVVFLMALHRVAGLVGELTEFLDSEVEKGEGKRRALWPRNTPCAVIERASCPDQRVIRTTLDKVVEAVEQEGSRPPGLLVVGAACEFLNKLQKGQAWTVEEGFRGLDFIGDELDLGA
ncbi:uroporphyrin-III C-methyltransferase [Annulohypoxylon maeteangense]|uniref:uroporphyrin-III C-methyltransferase n=1 Tax=Annulohypoxylon maeteangense TaxID=1927788 RepID=UPI002007A982|nr:uroporphyrin-III C-methyltransferase [Annulohypoxylon maeteangense]KAI0883967.1 uroporphyrin-III C-methyltransferase [Annulohypoxylon maeteangense]